jgi:maleylpyruvate isomerase
MAGSFILHGAVKSSAAWRARIALEIKGVAYREIHRDLHKGEHNAPEYLAINPQRLVPSLECPNGAIHSQSGAIIEYLEEAIPLPALLPRDLDSRAKARAMAQIIACDIHPVNNLRVRNHVAELLPDDPDAVAKWMEKWTKAGLDALETMLNASPATGAFAFGDAPGYFECFLVPHVRGARSMGRDISANKTINRIADACADFPAFRRADPANSPKS